MEYEYVDERGNVRRCTAYRNVGAFTDVQEMLRELSRRGIPPKQIPSGKTRSERGKEQWQQTIQ